MVYCTSGETPTPGEYQCTLCGGKLVVRCGCPLPICSVCDGAEFVMVLDG